MLHDGGTIETEGDRIRFRRANSLTLLLDAGTDFIQDRNKGWRGERPHARIAARLNAAAEATFDTLLAAPRGRLSATLPSRVAEAGKTGGRRFRPMSGS